MMEGVMNPTEESTWQADNADSWPTYDYPYNDDDLEEYNTCGPSSNFVNVFIPVVYSLVFVVGILGNGLMLGVLIKRRKVWGTTDTFILHRVVSDILLLVTLPFWAVESANDAGWVFGTFLCKLSGSVFRMNLYCGSLLLVCISVSYLLSIIPSTKEFMKKKPWVVHVCCVVVWILTILLSVPEWIFLESVKNSKENNTVCVRNYAKPDLDGWMDLDVISYKIVVRWLYLILGFLFPSVVLVLCCFCILWQVRCGTKGFQKQRAFKVIIAAVVIFFLCWTPYNIILLLDTVEISISSATECGKIISLDKALTGTFVLVHIHYCLNPILYLLIDVKYRRQLLNMWVKLRTDSSTF